MNETTEDRTRPEASGLSALAREIRAGAKADTVFGAPIRHGDVTLVPVARASFGLGGGKGRQGGGAGGGSVIKPMGFIVVDAAGARFCSIEATWTPARAGVVGLAIGIWLAKRQRHRR